jgi:plasmid stability protein
MEPLTADGLVTRNIFHTLLVFRAPTTLSEALAVLAAKRRTSLSAVIRDLLVAGLASEEGGRVS